MDDSQGANRYGRIPAPECAVTASKDLRARTLCLRTSAGAAISSERRHKQERTLTVRLYGYGWSPQIQGREPGQAVGHPGSKNKGREHSPPPVFASEWALRTKLRTSS